MRRPVKDRLRYRYWFNVIFCEVAFVGIHAILGGPFWPPYLLLGTMTIGVIVGLLGTVRLRRVLGLPVIPPKPRAVVRDTSSGPDLSPVDDAGDVPEARGRWQ